MVDTVRVKISSSQARQRFHGCDPDYIKNVCHGRCCRSSRPEGVLIAVLPKEAIVLRQVYGKKVEDGLLLADPLTKRCPVQSVEGFCGLHFSDHKPFGCIASPFALNKTNTLVIRNRYRLLICYDKEPRIPAYIAFRASLDLIFGKEEASRICDHLDTGGGDLYATMPHESWLALRTNADTHRHHIAGTDRQLPLEMP